LFGGAQKEIEKGRMPYRDEAQITPRQQAGRRASPEGVDVTLVSQIRRCRHHESSQTGLPSAEVVRVVRETDAECARFIGIFGCEW
jgi:hypothetical protein